MYSTDAFILIGGALLLLAILSSTLSGRIGLPGLVLFMGIGMLAGEDGFGGLVFNNYRLSHAMGTLALVLILFDGGLRTTKEAVHAAWKPAAALSTLGVLTTVAITGLVGAWLLELPIMVGLLLGAIVGSTDAAAVFSILRGQGLVLRERIAATLEVESGSNDPMAVLLTLACVSILTGAMEPGWTLVAFFLQQAVLGAVGGMVIGHFGVWLYNKATLTASGLYPVLSLGIGLLAYGLPAAVGGSGFFSVYIAGLIVGNSRIVFKRGTFLAHDGGAWVAQIAMFIMLGLLATPSRLIDVAPQGILIALTVTFLGRPAAVFLTLLPFRFDARELAFLSWAGLKGAIPIILAIYPLLLGVPQGLLLFDIVFFVVLLSALTQGWSLPLVAQWTGVRERAAPAPPVTLEISSVRHLDADIVEYHVEPGAFAAGRLVRELALPETAVVAMIARADEIIPPRGSTPMSTGDHVFVVMRPGVRPVVDRMFELRPPTADSTIEALELPIDAGARVGELEDFYGIHLDPDPERTLGDLMAERLGTELAVDARIIAGETCLSVMRMAGEQVELVGLRIFPEP